MPTRSTPAAQAPKRRTADIAYDAVETMLSTLELEPGSPVNEADLAHRTGLGRTPVREALLRMISIGLIVQQPRRGLLVSNIDLGDHLDLIQTRRVLEDLIAKCSARRASAMQRKEIVRCAEKMMKAAERGNLHEFMRGDQELDLVNHSACHNKSAVKSVIPLVVQCRRFWYAYQHEGDIIEGARAHMELAEGIATGDEAAAATGANRLLDYLEAFARRVIDR
ncbi:GntR family transcriptional regulator [Verminephrobacter aporrectodeae subsp. tuberculatae]|uniref:GntR family transcriptional regulator n=1 Tax=Verminephrobacter aporrectodeae TaxID=1110389 RepID=UPI00223742F1|nr:GntR family transcriptional regulator [Verminephrobacter aporrectodeae]MCW5223395.1 GntR family transcriptional regulator [Verminephrobacter aporrectodeae subsp. tuberculatae]MCW5256392.1 GntR family transcriptional regulator [Verminephrobacter aporrectodeae subsp. tuberculatae]MCW5288859.1 GntR family transcriptional regulator [Verminephrobacter aporrectodeae subsp. tuberculatae]